jgi:hypothetical protein
MSEQKMKRCRYCGTMTTVVPGYPPLCDSDECNKEDRETEIERNEQAREAAFEDGFNRYGGSGW